MKYEYYFSENTRIHLFIFKVILCMCVLPTIIPIDIISQSKNKNSSPSTLVLGH